VKPKVVEPAVHEFTEHVRCKRCDLPSVSKPKLKTYRCTICLFRSNKESWPFDSDASIEVPEQKHHGGGMYRVQVHSPMIKEIKKFRKNHWIKIPKERRLEILSGANLSEEYSRKYKQLLKFLRGVTKIGAREMDPFWRFISETQSWEQMVFDGQSYEWIWQPENV
jgi:hypothetical protein